MTPLVSLLVPTFNAAAYLGDLVRSIQAQTLADYEVVIVDDGSTDDTQSVLAAFRGDARFRVYRSSKNHGLGFSLRMLLELARGEYWCSPGADDLLEPDFLQQRVAKMLAYPDACLVHGLPHYINEHGATIQPAFPVPPPQEYLDGGEALALLLQHNFINQPSTLVRRSVTLGILPHYLAAWQYAPDWALWLLHAATGQGFVYDPQPRHRYRIHSSSLSLSAGLNSVRRAETRLVPLCTLSAAARFSPEARVLWAQWRQALYALWLRRRYAIGSAARLPAGAMALAAHAFYGPGHGAVSLGGELLKHSWSLVYCHFLENAARQRQSLEVSGLAQVDHPHFRKATPSL